MRGLSVSLVPSSTVLLKEYSRKAIGLAVAHPRSGTCVATAWVSADVDTLAPRGLAHVLPPRLLIVSSGRVAALHVGPAPEAHQVTPRSHTKWNAPSRYMPWSIN